MQIRIFIVTVLAVCVFAGCGGPPRPAGLPPLFPCDITIIQEGQPLEGALVRLIPESGVSEWAISGKTNANGVAIISTALFRGAPEGTFKVLVSKTDVTPSQHTEPEDINSPEWEGWNALVVTERRHTVMFVKPEYDQVRTTPHSITITKGRNQQTFDVGEPVAIRID